MAAKSVFSCRIVDITSYNALPIKDLDVCYSEFRSSAAARVPVIRIFGSTPAGQKACLHVHGIFPYILVRSPVTSPSPSYLQLLASSIDQALQLSMGGKGLKPDPQHHVFKITVVKGRAMYGYHEKEDIFLKIYLYNPALIKRLSELLVAGVVMGTVLQPHEAHIPFVLQMMIDYNLYGMNYINLSTVKFRPASERSLERREQNVSFSSPPPPPSLSPLSSSSSSTVLVSSPSQQVWNLDQLPRSMMSCVTRMSESELEVDAIAADILNIQNTSLCDGYPELAAVWEEERERRRLLGIRDPLTPPPSPDREVTSTERPDLVAAFASIVEERFGNSSQIEDTPASSTPLSRDHRPIRSRNLPGVARQLSMDDNPDATTEDVKGVEPVVDETAMQQSMELSQKLKIESLRESTDEELLDLMLELAQTPVSMAMQSSQSTTTDLPWTVAHSMCTRFSRRRSSSLSSSQQPGISFSPLSQPSPGNPSRQTSFTSSQPVSSTLPLSLPSSSSSSSSSAKRRSMTDSHSRIEFKEEVVVDDGDHDNGGGGEKSQSPAFSDQDLFGSDRSSSLPLSPSRCLEEETEEEVEEEEEEEVRVKKEEEEEREEEEEVKEEEVRVKKEKAVKEEEEENSSTLGEKVKNSEYLKSEAMEIADFSLSHFESFNTSTTSEILGIPSSEMMTESMVPKQEMAVDKQENEKLSERVKRGRTEEVKEETEGVKEESGGVKEESEEVGEEERLETVCLPSSQRRALLRELSWATREEGEATGLSESEVEEEEEDLREEEEGKEEEERESAEWLSGVWDDQLLTIPESPQSKIEQPDSPILGLDRDVAYDRIGQLDGPPDDTKNDKKSQKKKSKLNLSLKTYNTRKRHRSISLSPPLFSPPTPPATSLPSSSSSSSSSTSILATPSSTSSASTSILTTITTFSSSTSTTTSSSTTAASSTIFSTFTTPSTSTPALSPPLSGTNLNSHQLTSKWKSNALSHQPRVLLEKLTINKVAATQLETETENPSLAREKMMEEDVTPSTLRKQPLGHEREEEEGEETGEKERETETAEVVSQQHGTAEKNKTRVQRKRRRVVTESGKTPPVSAASSSSSSLKRRRRVTRSTDQQLETSQESGAEMTSDEVLSPSNRRGLNRRTKKRRLGMAKSRSKSRTKSPSSSSLPGVDRSEGGGDQQQRYPRQQEERKNSERRSITPLLSGHGNQFVEPVCHDPHHSDSILDKIRPEPMDQEPEQEPDLENGIETGNIFDSSSQISSQPIESDFDLKMTESEEGEEEVMEEVREVVREEEVREVREEEREVMAASARQDGERVEPSSDGRHGDESHSHGDKRKISCVLGTNLEHLDDIENSSSKNNEIVKSKLPVPVEPTTEVKVHQPSHMISHVIRPLTDPPSIGSLTSTADRYGLHPYTPPHPTPHYSQSSDSHPARVVNGKLLKIPTNLVNELPEADLVMPEKFSEDGVKVKATPLSASGLHHWKTILSMLSDASEQTVAATSRQTRSKTTTVPQDDQSRPNRTTTSKRRQSILTPLKLPPHPKDVKQWLEMKTKSKEKKIETETNSDNNESLLEGQTPRREANQPMNVTLTPFSLKKETSQLEGPTPQNTCGFKISQSALATSSHSHEFLTTCSIELHVRTRGSLRPDPECDPVLAIFYYIHHDYPTSNFDGQSRKNLTGVIAIDIENCGFQATVHASRVIKNASLSPRKRPKSSPNKQSLVDSKTTSPIGTLDRKHQPTAGFDGSDTAPRTLPPLAVARGYLSGCGQSDRGGEEEVEVEYVESEVGLIERLVDLCHSHDPDILLGYEITMTSWGYLIDRAAILNLNLTNQLSRIPHQEERHGDDRSDSGSGMRHKSPVRIPGRIVVSVWRLLRKELSLTSYTFESTFFQVMHRRVPMFPFQTLTQWYETAPLSKRAEVVDYYVLRCRGNYQMLERLNVIGRTSEFARLYGIEFENVFTRGSQYRVESMLLRLAKPSNYIAVSPSIQQRARMAAPECIPLVLEPESKFYSDPVLVLDFQSLYPSIVIAYNYCYTTCLGRLRGLELNGHFTFGATSLNVPLSTLKNVKDNVTVSPNGVVYVKQCVRKGVTPRMLEEILGTRVMVKQSMKKHKTDKALHRKLDARQMALKMVANTTYGYIAATYSGRMPCVEIADSIVGKARETLERAIKLISESKKWRARVVYGDTDSVFVLLKGVSKDEAFLIGREMCDSVTADNPKPVKLKFEKVYYPCILQTKKRYCGYMYETPDQKEPVYDAKGIETVRRDTCPAVAKILQKSLTLLFSTFDLSRVKSYVQKQMRKILDGHVSIQDHILAKEYRGRGSYKPGACVPALQLARRSTAIDPRAEPRPRERVPYVVVYGHPGQPLIQLVRPPEEVAKDPTLRLNGVYYVTKQVLPTLDRAFSLLGADVYQWYRDLPRVIKAPLPVPQETKDRKLKGTLGKYFATRHCPICNELTSRGVCSSCRGNPQLVATMLNRQIRDIEESHHSVVMLCQSCTGNIDPSVGGSCISLDCPIFFKRLHSLHSLSSTVPILTHHILTSLPPSS